MEAEIIRLTARVERLEGAAMMVVAWDNGLRHRTAHETKMVRASRAALSTHTEEPKT